MVIPATTILLIALIINRMKNNAQEMQQDNNDIYNDLVESGNNIFM